MTCILLLTGTNFPAGAQITPWEAAALMKKGINLGNTMEPENEGGWNNPPAQQYYFDLYRDAGFDVVRIPVRWDKHTQDTPPYAINEAWMQRVEQVVDWGLERDLFIVLNAHHEEWIKSDYGNAGKRARFDSIWSQISERFRDKSDRLIFEIINEPYGLTREQNNDLHQRVLSIIRKTNPTRLVIFQGHNWGGFQELLTAAIPDDDYLIGSFHSYDPWPFGLEGTGTFGSATDLNNLRNMFAAVRNWSLENDIPAFLGEFGCNKSADYNSRMKHYRAYVDMAGDYGIIPCAWDDGGNFRIMERESHGWNEIKDILIHSGSGAASGLKLKLYQDTVIRLDWTNKLASIDSIKVQRRTSAGSYATVATLPGEADSLLDAGLNQMKYYYYRILTYHDTSRVNFSQPQRIFLPVYEPIERGLFLGKAFSLPGTIEAEDFDIGADGMSYHDFDGVNVPGAYRPDVGVDIFEPADGSYQVGNLFAGEWLEYTVDVSAAGEYSLDVYLSAVLAGGKFMIRIGDVESDTLTTVNTWSWLTFQPVRTKMDLVAGEQIMRFTVISQPDFNIDKFVVSDATSVRGMVSDQKELVVFQAGGDDLIVSYRGAGILGPVGLYNMTGALVRYKTGNSSEQRFSVAGLPRGVYIVRAVAGEQIHFRKVIIDR